MDGKLFLVPNCCSYNKEYVWPINVSKEFLRSLGAVIHLERKKKVVLRSYRRPQSLMSSLLGLRGCRHFQSSAVNYSTMLLEADSERLYVGARGAVFALNASDISASSALTVSLFVCFPSCCMLCASAATSLPLPQPHLHSISQEPFEATIFQSEAKTFLCH